MKKLVLNLETLAALTLPEAAHVGGALTAANSCPATGCGPNCNSDGPNCDTVFCGTVGRKCPSLIACASPVCAPTEWPFCQ